MNNKQREIKFRACGGVVNRLTYEARSQPALAVGSSPGKELKITIE